MYQSICTFLQDSINPFCSNTVILFTMCVETLFFDLDDTLYPPTCGIWEAIGVRMERYMVEKLSIPALSASAERDRLFHTHGTTMRGLVAEYGIDDSEFLIYVHDIPVKNYISTNDFLRKTLLQYPQRKIIFTNANTSHAVRVLTALGIMDLFEQIIDICSIKPWCKPQRDAFCKALELVGINEPHKCAMIDDAPPNLITAHELGMYTIQVGAEIKTDPIDAAILSIEQLPMAFPIRDRLGENV